MNSEIRPACPDTFKKELDAIRFPTPEKQPRKPIDWLVPVIEIEGECSEQEEATQKANTNMMTYIKLLQKHHSDLIMTNKILPFNEEEKKMWSEDRDQIMFKIVENFSIIEVVKLFPKLVSKDENGKIVFNMAAFTGVSSKTKDGQLYIDEYKLNDMVKELKLKEKKTLEDIPEDATLEEVKEKEFLD